MFLGSLIVTVLDVFPAENIALGGFSKNQWVHFNIHLFFVALITVAVAVVLVVAIVSFVFVELVAVELVTTFSDYD